MSERSLNRDETQGASSVSALGPSVSRVIFMCGPSGSGKSTYARRLENEGMIRLSFDTEMWRRGITTVPLPPRARRGEHPDDYVLPEELAAEYFDHFEPPTPDEGPLDVIRYAPD